MSIYNVNNSVKMLWHREWFIRVPWGKLSLVSRGHPDGEPVLLVHGRQDSLTVFEPLLEKMSEQYYYVAIDMPGNGLSDAFPLGQKLMRFHFLYAMELAVRHLGWDQFIFVGHSMGCEQGLFFNVIYPGVISKMILLDAGPTLMRMQIEDNSEYQKMFYDSYYDNYDKENFQRKTHTRKTASQSIQRQRGLDENQSNQILARNFHEYGITRADACLWNPSGVKHGSRAVQSLEEGEESDEQMFIDSPDEDEPQDAHRPRHRNGPRNENGHRVRFANIPQIINDPEEANVPRNVNVPRAERPPWYDNALETLRANSNRVRFANRPQIINEPRDANEVPSPDRDNGICGFLRRLTENENDRPGYLSWDNRLKNLAPQNYGNDYYFELFKTIPPTLLIAASDGAKIVPNPKWRAGAKQLLDKMATLENFYRVDVEGSHDVHFTHPERVLPHINAFLKDIKVFSKL